MRLFRPVGVEELRLIAESDWREFPPRLEWQPIFYPVLTQEYAASIARDWNTIDKPSGFAGFVTRFEVEDSVGSKYPVQEVGGQACRELWVPAEELAEFNRAIEGPIQVVEMFYGEKFEGDKDPDTGLPLFA